MNNIVLFANNLNSIINDDTQFIKRKSNDNKLNLKNTLYASLLSLNFTGIANTAADLEIDHITTVTRTALIRKRNNDVTYKCIKNINDSMIDMIYNPENNFLKSYNLKIGHNGTSYANNYGPVNKKLFINTTSKIFVACDGMHKSNACNLSFYCRYMHFYI